MKKEVLIVLSCFFCLSLFSQKVNVKKFNLDDGFNAPIVYDLQQDERGYLWVASANGLFQYDGGEFRLYSLENGLNDVYCTDLQLLGPDHLWVSHYDGSFTEIVNDSVKRVITYTQKFGSASKVVLGSNKECYGLLPNYGLVSLTDSTHKISLSEEIMGMLIDAYCIKNQEFLVGSSDGLFTYKEGKVSKVDQAPFSMLMSLTKLNVDEFLLGTDKGVFVFSLITKSFKKLVTLENVQINSIRKYLDQSLLMSTTAGVYIAELDSVNQVKFISHYDKKHGLPSEYINTAIRTKEGEIWMATFGDYLLKVKDVNVGVTNLRTSCRDLFFYNDTLLVSTAEGLAIYDDQIDSLTYLLHNDMIGALYTYENNQVLVSVAGKLHVLDLVTRELTSIATLASFNVKSILYDETHKGYWLTLFNNGVVFWNKTTLQHFNTQNGLSHNNIENVYVDSKGTVWLPTANSKLSILDFDTGSFTYLGMDDGLRTTHITDVCEDRAGNIWMTSLGQGIFFYDGKKIEQYSSSTGLPTNYFYSVTTNGNVMTFMTKSSVMILNLDTKEQVVRDIVNDAGSILATKVFMYKGEKYCNTTNGFITYNVAKEKWHIYANVDLLGVDINGVNHFSSKQIELPSGDYDVRFNYNGISLSHYSNLLYRYKLIGLHSEWQYTLDENVLFPSLRDGEFEFVIQSSIDRILWSKAQHKKIVIDKPIWKHWWFYVIIFLLLIGVVYLIFTQRIKRLKYAKIILEQKVKNRTIELEAQKEKVMLQKDELEEKNTAITDSINYAEKIQRAVMSPKHKDEFSMLNKLFILNKPRDIVSGDFYWLTEKDGKDYIIVADCTGHGVPGAFMSMLGITFLNRIINEEGCDDAGEILNQLRTKIVHTLTNDTQERQSNDGMDISVLIFDLEQNKVQFAGANNPLVFIRDGEAHRVKGDKMPVGLSSFMDQSFTSQEVEMQKGDVFYIFSDGYADQFGGPQGKKFMTKKFRELLVQISDLPLDKQREKLNWIIEDWGKEESQVDDILVMGIKP